MINYIITDDINQIIETRLNSIAAMKHSYKDKNDELEFIIKSIEFFNTANQTTIIAVDNQIIGSATLCYYSIAPSFNNKTGKCAMLMNVYTDEHYRHKGIAKKMIELLIKEAKDKGVSEVSLDSSEIGKPFYEQIGFHNSKKRMIMDI